MRGNELATWLAGARLSLLRDEFADDLGSERIHIVGVDGQVAVTVAVGLAAEAEMVGDYPDLGSADGSCLAGLMTLLQPGIPGLCEGGTVISHESSQAAGDQALMGGPRNG